MYVLLLAFAFALAVRGHIIAVRRVWRVLRAQGSRHCRFVLRVWRAYTCVRISTEGLIDDQNKIEVVSSSEPVMCQV